MAFFRRRDRADGTTAWAVLYSVNNQQTSTTFDTEADAQEFRQAVNTIGAERAMKGWGATLTKRAAQRTTGLTAAEWIDKHIATRSGVAKSTLYDYRAYRRNDIAPTLGPIPLELLAPDDVAAWVDEL